MPISRYPRLGHRLAPLTLAPLLHAPAHLPKGDMPPPRLDELDETVWTRFDAETCKDLARQVVEQVRVRLPLEDPDISARHLPSVPGRMSLDDLELETRTRNLLAEEGHEESLEALLRLTLEELLEIPGFGARCLVDLLTSVEDFDINVVRYPWASRRFSEILGYEIDNLAAASSGSLIHRDDPRFRHALRTVQTLLPNPSDYLSLRDLVGQVREQAAEARKPVELINALQDLRILMDSVIDAYLEDELLDLIPGGASAPSPRSATDGRNREVFYLRMGWDGAGRRSLRAVAARIGMSQESVRKICNQFLVTLEGSRPFTPSLTRALTLLQKSTPGAADELEQLLQKEGLTRGRFDLESLVAAANMLGWETNLRIDSANGQRYAVHATEAGLPAAIARVAEDAVTHWGMANVGDVAAKITAHDRFEPRAPRVEARFVIQVLERIDGLHWLDAPGGWFWLSTVRHNRLLTQVRKIMAVSRELDVNDLRRGIARHHRMEGFAPPPDVLLELCRQQPELAVEGDLVVVDPGVDWRDGLGPAEQLIVQVMLENGRVMDVESFERECRRRGLKESTFFTYLDYSPLLTKHARGLYGLRGSRRPDRPPAPTTRRRVLMGHGRDPDGTIWMDYRLSRSAVVGGIVGVPAALRDELSGEYTLFASDGTLAGTLKIDRGLAWRLNPFFRMAGVQAGDALRLELHPERGRAVAMRLDGADGAAASKAEAEADQHSQSSPNRAAQAEEKSASADL